MEGPVPVGTEGRGEGTGTGHPGQSPEHEHGPETATGRIERPGSGERHGHDHQAEVVAQDDQSQGAQDEPPPVVEQGGPQPDHEKGNRQDGRVEVVDDTVPEQRACDVGEEERLVPGAAHAGGVEQRGEGDQPRPERDGLRREEPRDWRPASTAARRGTAPARDGRRRHSSRSCSARETGSARASTPPGRTPPDRGCWTGKWRAGTSRGRRQPQPVRTRPPEPTGRPTASPGAARRQFPRQQTPSSVRPPRSRSRVTYRRYVRRPEGNGGLERGGA